MLQAFCLIKQVHIEHLFLPNILLKYKEPVGRIELGMFFVLYLQLLHLSKRSLYHAG
nr:MAG TPA: hypothetical protein [Caudoviricetes sp.]